MVNQKLKEGFIAFYLIILILAVVFIIAVSISILTYGEEKISRNIISSSQAYYTAEAGIEDALLRLAKPMNWSSPYNLGVGNGTTTVEISNIVGGVRTITSRGDVLNRIRKVQVVYTISTQEISFYYGAQVGEGGMLMGNNSRVKGNIYSNGNVLAAKGGDKGFIDETIVVALNGNRIEGLQIGKDAKVHTCKDSTIGGTLTYVSGGSVQNCTAGESIKTRPDEIPTKDLPISQTQINQWKNEAEAGGMIMGDYTISGKITQNLGPVKITGNLLVDNNATLNMTGTIWVVGNLRIDNGSTLKLDLNSYGPNSGTIIADGKIKVRPNTYLKGSGQEGSYILLLSTNPETLDTSYPALDIDNNTDATIFYTSQGLIVLRNNIKAREVAGYKVFLDNNAEIEYESGLEETNFSSGPGGSWEVVSWQEVE